MLGLFLVAKSLKGLELMFVFWSKGGELVFVFWSKGMELVGEIDSTNRK